MENDGGRHWERAGECVVFMRDEPERECRTVGSRPITLLAPESFSHPFRGLEEFVPGTRNTFDVHYALSSRAGSGWNVLVIPQAEPAACFPCAERTRRPGGGGGSNSTSVIVWRAFYNPKLRAKQTRFSLHTRTLFGPTGCRPRRKLCICRRCPGR